MILFFIFLGGPFSPFENNWNLKEEYKRNNKRIELARKLSTQITWLAIINLLFSPFLFLWQFMYFFFTYADVSIILFTQFSYIILFFVVLFFY